MQEKLDITNKYSYELQEISNKLNQLRNKRIYEITNAKMDGFMATNIDQLENMIAELIGKIEKGQESTMENLLRTFGVGNNNL